MRVHRVLHALRGPRGRRGVKGRQSEAADPGLPGAVAMGLSLSEQSSRDDPHGEWIAAYTREQTLDQWRARISNMRRSVVTASQQHDDAMRESRVRFRRVLVTFTYAPGVTPQAGQLREALLRMRKWVERQGAHWRCVWVLEFHRSGRPHYHAMLWLPKRLLLPKPDKRGWWTHGATNVRGQMADKIKRGGSYLAKYLSKGCEAVAQAYRGARSFGVAGLEHVRKLIVRYWRQPGWLDACPATLQGRAPGGGWRVAGEVHVSPWEWSGGRIRLAEWVYRVDGGIACASC